MLSQGLFSGGLAVMIAAVAIGLLITGQWSSSVLFLTMGAAAM
ncbi:hypothetical protein [Mycobacteroides abscessus]|nr:hypothetical protein [Mycobacteroides abscessus]